MPGTARPPIRPAAGMEHCLMPNASPNLPGLTAREIPRFAAGWARPLASPPTTRAAIRTPNDGARPAPLRAIAARTAEATTPLAAPIRWTSRPSRRAQIPETANSVAAAMPIWAGPMPRSARICTARAPTRNAGRTPRVVTVTAWTSVPPAPGGGADVTTSRLLCGEFRRQRPVCRCFVWRCRCFVWRCRCRCRCRCR